MNAATIFDICLYAAMAMLMLAMLMTAARVVLGPTLADRVLALDQLTAIAIGFIATIAVRTGYDLYIDIALALGLVGFLATAAFARYIVMSLRDNKTVSKIEAE
jgi:multicomponent Na+:H+ antiporter subunit F